MVDRGVSEHTCIKWRDTFREVCHTSIKKNSTKIGGLGKFVEVDEAHLFRRKYNRGHRVQGESIWILGDKALEFLAHETVVHRTDFVNPIFREIFTNTIECVWGKLKRTVRRGGKLARVDQFISEYLYRTMLGVKYGPHNYSSQLVHFIKDIKSSQKNF
ncbi:hypothetical protein Ocin01_19111 [Orchesella cincta]|uniref:ISXO2-like transposase domain-containing protein n=1 Tax=Orchesella cincta TaxID=48709 RepID=A0A1D2M3T6_ORCCI|nr:hypothetical protein Ocin01_19111 [Orchesella cincta]